MRHHVLSRPVLQDEKILREAWYAAKGVEPAVQEAVSNAHIRHHVLERDGLDELEGSINSPLKA